MAFKGMENFSHGQADKVAVVLVNLGTPEAATTPALRKYLAEFLSDPRVVEIPRVLWMLILHGIILRLRPKKSAHAYQQVWTDEGSPLMAISKAQTKAIREHLSARYGDKVMVDLAMRYGQPSLANTVDSLLEQGARKVLVLPLYPQYSGPTTATVFDALAADFTKRRWLPHLRFVANYHNYQPYIDALAESVEAYWKEHGKPEKLVLSYHGVPKLFLSKGDPYHCHCHVTTRLLVQKLGLTEQDYITTFQSRFGKAEWLKPYTDETLKSLGAEGVKHVQVICPGFAADCLETLEEIEVENREYFIESGGERFEYIPALNARESHIDALLALIEREAGNWLTDITSEQALLERAKAYSEHAYNK